MQPVDLVPHARPSAVRRLDQRRIQFPDRFAYRRHRPLYPRVSFRKARLQFRRQRTRRNRFSHPLGAEKHIRQAELVARQNALRLRFHQSRRKPRQDRRHSSQQFLVHHRHLREVCDLRRPSRVDQRRQQVILHHRTKQHIRIKLFRRSLNPVQQLPVRNSLLANHILDAAAPIAPAPYHRARTVFHLKKQRGRGSHFNLLVISRRLDRFAPRQQRLIQF